jgi:hypothetical protein
MVSVPAGFYGKVSITEGRVGKHNYHHDSIELFADVTLVRECERSDTITDWVSSQTRFRATWII